MLGSGAVPVYSIVGDCRQQLGHPSQEFRVKGLSILGLRRNGLPRDNDLCV